MSVIVPGGRYPLSMGEYPQHRSSVDRVKLMRGMFWSPKSNSEPIRTKNHRLGHGIVGEVAPDKTMWI